MMIVALVGKGYGWWNYRKRKDEFDEIWAIGSQFFHMGKDCTTVVDMHDYEWDYEGILEHTHAMGVEAPALVIENEAFVLTQTMPARIKAINKRKLPVVSVRKYDFVPTSIEYPKEKIIRDVCHGIEFLTSTVSHAIAYALYLGNVTHFCLYGISGKDGYSEQHPSIAFISGIALERGMKIEIDRSGGSDILKPRPFYGYMER